MKSMKEFNCALDCLLYLRKEEGYELGWDSEKNEAIPSSFGEKWKAEISDADGNINEDLLKGEWTEFDGDEAVYHETASGKSVYAIVKNIEGKKAIISVVYK